MSACSGEDCPYCKCKAKLEKKKFIIPSQESKEIEEEWPQWKKDIMKMDSLDEELVELDREELLKRFHNRDSDIIYKFTMERSRAIGAGEIEQGDPTTAKEKEIWGAYGKKEMKPIDKRLE